MISTPQCPAHPARCTAATNPAVSSAPWPGLRRLLMVSSHRLPWTCSAASSSSTTKTLSMGRMSGKDSFGVPPRRTCQVSTTSPPWGLSTPVTKSITRLQRLQVRHRHRLQGHPHTVVAGVRGQSVEGLRESLRADEVARPEGGELSAHLDGGHTELRGGGEEVAAHLVRGGTQLAGGPPVGDELQLDVLQTGIRD